MLKSSSQRLSIGSLRLSLSVDVFMAHVSSSRIRRFSKACVSRTRHNTSNSLLTRSIPKMIIDFVKEETNFITQSLVRDDLLTDHFNKAEGLSKDVRESLDSAVDENSKLLKVLSLNPSEVPPSLYLYLLHNKRLTMADDLKSILVHRLAFHQMFNDIWSIMIDETSTINDVEIIVEIIGKVMDTNNHRCAGICAAIISSEHAVTNASLRSIIVDSFAHNFSIQRSEIKEALYHYTKLPTAEDHIFSPNTVYSFLVELQKIFESSKSVLLGIRELRRSGGGQWGPSPGWFNFSTRNIAVSKFEKNEMLDILRAMEGYGLNDYDIKTIMDAGCIPLDAVYDAFRKEYTKTKHISWSLTRLAEKALETGNSNLLQSILISDYRLVSNAIIGKSLLHLYENDFSTFDKLLSQLTSELGGRNYVPAFSIFFSEITPNQSSVSVHKAFLMYAREPGNVGNLKHHLEVSRGDRDSIIKAYREFSISNKGPTKLLLEVLRNLAVRNDIVDKVIFGQIFVSIVSKTTKVNGDGRRTLDERYKKKFHNTIRALAQLLSDMKYESMKQALEVLNQEVLNSQKFSSSDDRFQRYLQRRLILETCGFVYRKDPLTNFGHLLDDLNVPSRLRDYVICLYTVRNDPQQCFTMIRKYKNNKSGLNRQKISGMEMGILTCSSLAPVERLRTFKSFRDELREHGFKSRLSVQNLTEIIDIVMDSSKSSDEMLNKLLSFASGKKIPQRKLNSWSGDRRRRG